MQISSSLFPNPIPTGSVPDSKTLLRQPAVQTGVFLPSAAFSLAASLGVSDLSFQTNNISWGYRRDGSLALKVQSSLDVRLHREEIALDVTLPAELLGLDLTGSLFKNGPLRLNLEYFFNQSEISSRIDAQKVDTLRKPDEILRDLGEALSTVLRQKGDKNLAVFLDEEAMQVLLSDPAITRLMKELAALICMVNSTALEGGQREQYTILVSGKGKPYLDVRSQTAVDVQETRLRVQLTIMPPQGGTPCLEGE